MNFLLHLAHLSVIMFTLFAWLIKDFLFLHLILCILILFSWFVVGLIIGKPGFCVITGIQQYFRSKFMPKDEPMGNYMHFLTKRLIRKEISSRTVDLYTQFIFYFLVALSTTLNIKAGNLINLTP